MKAKKPEKAGDVLKIARACIEGGTVGFTGHALDRLKERGISVGDTYEVIKTGHRVLSRDRYSEEHQGWNYAIEGKTYKGKNLRIIIGFDDAGLLIITVIRLVKGV